MRSIVSIKWLNYNIFAACLDQALACFCSIPFLFSSVFLYFSSFFQQFSLHSFFLFTFLLEATSKQNVSVKGKVTIYKEKIEKHLEQKIKPIFPTIVQPAGN